MSSTVFVIFNEYPILPIFQTLSNSFAFLACLLVFIVIQTTELHENCRFLFTIWSLGFLGIFSSQVLLSLTSFFCQHGYLADAINDPPVRLRLYCVELAAIFVATSMEVLIALERVLSAVYPARYHDAHKLARKAALPILAITLAGATASAYIAVGSSYLLTGSIFFALDFSAILMNTVAMVYCRRRDLAERRGKAPLNVRYQVKESADMASAMQPALIIAFLIKTSSNVVFMSMCFRMDSAECISLLLSINWGIMEAFFLTNTIITGVFINVWVILKNPRLKRNAERLRARIWCNGRVASSSAVNNTQKKNETDLYFSELRRAWE